MRATARDVDVAFEKREAWDAARQEAVRAARDELVVIPGDERRGRRPGDARAAGSRRRAAHRREGPPLPKGEALHKVLELVDLRDPKDVDQIARGVCLVAGVEEAAEEVAAMARACLASDALARALRADEIWREVPYTRRVERATRPAAWMWCSERATDSGHRLEIGQRRAGWCSRCCTGSPRGQSEAYRGGS